MSTQCRNCGATIQDVTAEATGGRCVPCARQNVPNTDPIAKLRSETYKYWSPLIPDSETLLVATFSAGFSSDLTHWQTKLNSDGNLFQRIFWNNFDHPYDRKGVDERRLKISSESLASIQNIILALDVPSLRPLHLLSTMDDAAVAIIEIPSRKVSASLPIFVIENAQNQTSIPLAAIAGCDWFRDLWNSIDQMSPYSLRDHWK